MEAQAASYSSNEGQSLITLNTETQRQLEFLTMQKKYSPEYSVNYKKKKKKTRRKYALVFPDIGPQALQDYDHRTKGKT